MKANKVQLIGGGVAVLVGVHRLLAGRMIAGFAFIVLGVALVAIVLWERKKAPPE